MQLFVYLHPNWMICEGAFESPFFVLNSEKNDR
jgi:hypothetical protein